MAAGGTDDVFASAVPRWVERLGTVREVVRQELVTRQLREHVPDRPRLRVLDVGCGQGTQAIRLAVAGHRVDGVDRSTELLDRARRGADAQPVEVRERLRWHRADLFDLAARRPGAWDVVCCHGVIMYLPSLAGAVAALVRLARPGGLVSILSRSQASIAMRAGVLGRWREAVDGFDAEHYDNRLGLTGVRADRPEAVHAALAEAGAAPLAWYGVRLFTDHWEGATAPDDLPELLAAEEQAGRRDLYRRLAAPTHTLGSRTPLPPASSS